MKTWTTINGDEISYKKLEDSHLRNILKWIQRRARHGVTIMYGGGGWDIEDMWYDEETLFGKEVLEKYDYAGLLKEAKRRKLITSK